VYELLLILHFLGLALGVGAGFAGLTLRRSVKGLPPAELGPLMQRFSVVGKNGSYGLLLLIVSGIALSLYRGFRETLAWGGPAFHAKLTLVILMCGVFGYLQVLQKKARTGGGAAVLTRIPKVATLMLILGVSVVIAAVLAFK